MENVLQSYKERKPDSSKPVWVYRNLNCKDVSYSISQNGLVVAHTKSLKLCNVKFIVRKAGKLKVQRERRKNVHAFIRGYISTEKFETLENKVSYNPYSEKNFVDGHGELKQAARLIITEKGVFI